MGVINNARLVAIARVYRALFFQALEQGKNELAAMALQFMMEVESTGQVENYNWVGDVPAMQEWTDDRPLTHLRANGFYLENKEWANGLVMKAADIEDDRLGMMLPRINSLADSYLMHVFTQMVSLIENGASTACYDGQSFFDTDHSEGSSGTQANYTSSGALSSNTFRAARAMMQELLNDQGNLLGVRPTHLWCGTTLEGTAREICLAERDSAGATNMDRGLCQPLIIPGLASSTMWGLVDLSKPLKPFVKQNRRPVSFTALTDAESPEFFKRREVQFGADYRGNYGYAFWQLMFMSTGT